MLNFKCRAKLFESNEKATLECFTIRDINVITNTSNKEAAIVTTNVNGIVKS